MRGVLLKLQSNKKATNLYEELPERIKQDFWLPLAQEYYDREQKKKKSDSDDVETLSHQQLIDLYSRSSHGRGIAT